MPYTTKELVRHALNPNADPDLAPDQGETAASLVDARLDEIIDMVDGRIDTFLTRQYTVPLQEPVPRIVRDIATAISAYEATLAFYGSVDISDTDPVIRRYRDARGMLGQLGTGLLTLQIAGADETTDDPIVINPSSAPRCSGGLHYLVVRELPQSIYPWGRV